MTSTPRTGDGYSDNEQAKKDVLLDAQFKKFQADFAKVPPKVSAKDVIRNAFRKGKS